MGPRARPGDEGPSRRRRAAAGWNPGPIGYRGDRTQLVERRRDPWAPFRIWIALTIGLYALRAAFVTTPLGAIPGFVVLAMVLGALVLAARPCSGQDG